MNYLIDPPYDTPDDKMYAWIANKTNDENERAYWFYVWCGCVKLYAQVFQIGKHSNGQS